MSNQSEQHNMQCGWELAEGLLGESSSKSHPSLTWLSSYVFFRLIKSSGPLEQLASKMSKECGDSCLTCLVGFVGKSFHLRTMGKKNDGAGEEINMSHTVSWDKIWTHDFFNTVRNDKRSSLLSTHYRCFLCRLLKWLVGNFGWNMLPPIGEFALWGEIGRKNKLEYPEKTEHWVLNSLLLIL